MQTEISVRRAVEADIPHLIEFNCAMARETEGKELVPDVISAGVANLLRNPQYGFYVVAEISGDMAGALMVTSEWSDWRNGLFWWIQSVYVKADYRKRGVYRSLYDSVKKLALQENNICGFRLYVEKENLVAQQTYQNLGMEETHYKMFEELLVR